MTPDPTIRPHPDVVYTRFDETSGALLHLKTKRYYTLNETGARIWELLVAGEGVAAIAAALHTEYEITEDEAAAHVAELVNELRGEKLVEVGS